MGLSLSANWNGDSYDLILVIVNGLTKIVHYKPVQVIIDVSEQIEMIVNVIVQYNGLFDSIISDREALFTSKFWSLLCYFLGIKRQLSTVFLL